MDTMKFKSLVGSIKLSIKDFFLIAACIIIGVLYFQNRKLSNVIVNNTVALAIMPVEKKTDKKGTEYAEIKQTVYTQAQVNHITDSIRRALGASKVTGITTEVSNLNGQVSTSNTVYLDTINHTVDDSYTDKDVHLTYHGDLKARIGTFGFDFSPDTATYISTVKNHLFKPNEHFIAAYHTNNYFKKAVVAGSSFTYKEPKVLFTVGPYIGYDLIQRKPSVGISVQFNCFSIKSKK